ncbi:unnamed protein product, partial [Laminaria digitata]
LQQKRKRRRPLVLTATPGIEVAKVMGVTDLALEELTKYKEYACNKVRELGLDSGEVIDATVLEGRTYPHLEAMRYRLRLLQTLVCVTSHVITSAQAEGLWLGLVERALSEAELDLSFEALLGLGREAPQGLPMLAGTFFERMCGGGGSGGGSARDWRKSQEGTTATSQLPTGTSPLPTATTPLPVATPQIPTAAPSPTKTVNTTPSSSTPIE